MKKVLAFILAVMMVLPLALTGCKTGDDTGGRRKCHTYNCK